MWGDDGGDGDEEYKDLGLCRENEWRVSSVMICSGFEVCWEHCIVLEVVTILQITAFMSPFLYSVCMHAFWLVTILQITALRLHSQVLSPYIV